MKKLIWIVAQNPKTETNIKRPLVNTKSLEVLRRWVGKLPPEVSMFASNACSNLGKPRLTKHDIIRLKVTHDLKKPDKIIALGTIASKALSKVGVEHFRAEHPSGLNRKLNDKEYVDKMIRSMRKYIDKP